jgi:ferric-dicitrate binding protein FerR (iron transport regulator)/Mg-chelatase subunit ChlD
MSDRAQKYEAFLDELAPIVDGDREALERHADFLADDDEARDLRHDALETAAEIAIAGNDYVPPVDLEAKLLAALDAGKGEPGRTTSPGFATGGAVSSASSHAEPSVPITQNPPPPTFPPQTFSPQEVTFPPAQPLAYTPAPHSFEPKPLAYTPQPMYPPSSGSGPVSETIARKVTQPMGTGDPPPVAAPAQAKPEKKSKLGLLIGLPVAGLALAAAAAVALFVWGGGSNEDASGETRQTVANSGIEGTLEMIDRAADDGRTGVEVRRAGSEAFVALASGEAIPAGTAVRTDERTRAAIVLADGSRVVLNHATELELVGDTPRSFRLTSGEVVADIAHLDEGPHAFFHTPNGRVEVLGTKFELTATQEITSVRVTRGAVTLAAGESAPSEVRAGEEGLVRGSNAPIVAAVTDLARSMAWSELGPEPSVEEATQEDQAIAGIGSLTARRPGEQTDHDRPVTLASHQVRVRIVGNVARTEIEEVFRNDSDVTLEGIYRFPLPPDAQIARLALDVEGRMEEGSFVERDRAAQIWRGVIRNATAPRERRNDEEFIWVPGPWHDPALLEWQRGGQFELRIFPIPAHGERRVILGYTQTVAPQGDRRRYVYPLAHSGDGSTRVGRFDVDVRVAGAQEVRASGYELDATEEEGATRLRFAGDAFLPKGDLVVEYALPGAERELSWWTYRGNAAAPPPQDSREQDREVLDLQRQLSEDGRGYVAFALRPNLPRGTERRDRDYVIVVDASQSMVGERFDRATRLATELVSEMDRRDRFTVLACDYACRSISGGMRTPGAAAAQEVTTFLSDIDPAGASDLIAAFRDAIANVSGERREGREVHLMYVGDGVSSAGYRRASSLTAEARAIAEEARVAISTIGIGGDADTLALSAIARGTGGHYVPYVPGERASVAALGVLETTYGVSLESPVVELPQGLSEIAPSQLPTVRAGEEVVFVARMDGERVQGDVVLRGRAAGRPFEQRYRVELVPTDAAGNLFVPRLWAAGQIDELQLRGRGDERARIVALSKSFGVMSRHTSLLVLESEAMFRAFRVDRNQSAPTWTGEEDVVAGGTDGSVMVGGLAGGDADSAGMGGLGTVGQGRTSGGGYGVGERRARAGAPMPMQQQPQAPPQAVARPARREAESASDAPAAEAAPMWNDMPAVPPQDPAMTQRPMPRPPGRPGQWMRRVSYRAGEIVTSADPTETERDAARDAELALRENQDSRDRTREAVRQLSRAGDLERALEITRAWVARDRLDAEALTAQADLLGRLGRRDEALRYLTGTADLTPNNEALHLRLARAFERIGRPERACAHRIAIAEINESSPEALAEAMRCERALARTAAADRLMNGVRDPDVRVRAERVLSREVQEESFRGDFTIDAEWEEDVDLDLTIVTAQGTRLSWMGGRTTVVGDRTTSTDGERLGLRFTGVGTYTIEVNRTDPTDTREVRGRLRIRALGEERTVPFVLRSAAREPVARVRVTRETRLESVTGTVNQPVPF